MDPKHEDLDMSPEEFRKWGYRAIDWIVDYFAHPERYPVLSQSEPGSTRRRLPDAPPREGEAMDEIFRDFEEKILPGVTHWNHPSFFAYFAITGSAPGILGELLTSALNINAMLWKTSPSATELEEVSLSWLRQMMGLPDDFFGIIYDTASVSSLCALAAAREAVEGLDVREQGLCGSKPLRLYASEQAHSHVDKVALLLGLGERGLRHIPVDEEFRLRPDALEEAVRQDIDDGYLPFAVVASVGTTSTTSIDPIPAIREVSKRHGLWLHVDAAYGGAAAVIPERRSILDGCAEADSLVVSPHKWLFTPLDLSVLYCRRPQFLRRAFGLVAEYLRTSEGDKVVNYMDYGIQPGRRFRALKLWMVIRYFGVWGLAERIREHLRLAQELASWIDSDPDFERMAPTPLSLVCFRARPAGLNDEAVDQLNEQILEAVNASGEAFLSHTKLRGRFVLRMSISNLRTTESHVRETWELIRDQGRRIARATP